MYVCFQECNILENCSGIILWHHPSCYFKFGLAGSVLFYMYCFGRCWSEQLNWSPFLIFVVAVVILISFPECIFFHHSKMLQGCPCQQLSGHDSESGGTSPDLEFFAWRTFSSYCLNGFKHRVNGKLFLSPF